MGAYDKLVTINVNEHTEKKNGLTYLTWSWAWDAVKKLYPEASYTIWKDEKGLPYVYDSLTGYMVYTSVTIEGITHEMWLPVMDGSNKAMKSEPYTYKVKEYENYKWTGKWVEKTVEPATMFDINKSIMRCLVKNLAMFGLGLYIYSGEDLPQQDELITQAITYIKARKAEYQKGVLDHYKLKKLDDMSKEQAEDFISSINKKENKTV